jgi:hypothetical protein
MTAPHHTGWAGDWPRSTFLLVLPVDAKGGLMRILQGVFAFFLVLAAGNFNATRPGTIIGSISAAVNPTEVQSQFDKRKQRWNETKNMHDWFFSLSSNMTKESF